MKRLLCACLLVASFVVSGSVAEERESVLWEAHQEALDQWICALSDADIETIPLRLKEDADPDGTFVIVSCEVLPEQPLWISYWDDNTVDILLMIDKASPAEKDKDAVFIRLLDAFLPDLSFPEAEVLYAELWEATQTSTAQGGILSAVIEPDLSDVDTVYAIDVMLNDSEENTGLYLLFDIEHDLEVSEAVEDDLVDFE